VAQVSVVKAEVERWRYKWKSESSHSPSNAIDALSHCHPNIFPNIRRLLQIMATLPVSTATAERSFSTLRRLKTYTRSTMAEDRLNGLALLSIHRERSVSIKDVIDGFALAPRRLDLVL
jgi:hypothetical protein